MLLNRILLSCYFCKNPYSTRRHRSQRRHEYNFTLRATILTDMKAPLAYCSKATKKMCAARAKNSWNRGLHLSAGRAKKTGKGSPLSAVTLQKIDKHATEASQKLNYAHSQWNFSEYTVQGEPWPKKNAGTKCNDGKFYCPDKKHFFMECQMSNRLRELILRCSALKNHYWKRIP